MGKNIDNSLTAKEIKTLEVLRRVLDKYGVNAAYYSLSGHREQAACIQKTYGSWLCFNVERGAKFQKEKANNVKDACLLLIKRMADSREDEKIMSEEFKKELLELKI